ncbi:BPI fold-containing family A member 2-like, partial [Mus pahari]|uniref:BPI fold-containing family A member 2-like n=1 Tax=Mus pahari TaxID=10093 RepID=UPI000A305DE1
LLSGTSTSVLGNNVSNLNNLDNLNSTSEEVLKNLNSDFQLLQDQPLDIRNALGAVNIPLEIYLSYPHWSNIKLSSMLKAIELRLLLISKASMSMPSISSTFNISAFLDFIYSLNTLTGAQTGIHFLAIRKCLINIDKIFTSLLT